MSVLITNATAVTLRKQSPPLCTVGLLLWGMHSDKLSNVVSSRRDALAVWAASSSSLHGGLLGIQGLPWRSRRWTRQGCRSRVRCAWQCGCCRLSPCARKCRPSHTCAQHLHNKASIHVPWLLLVKLWLYQVKISVLCAGVLDQLKGYPAVTQWC